MLLHSCVKWCIIFFGPSTERMEEKNGVLVTFLEELFSGVIEEENVAIVKGISDLEGIDNIGILFLHHVVDLDWGESVLVKAVIELDFLDESSLASRDQEVSLGHDSLNLGVLLGECSECSGRDFFFSVFEVYWVLDNGNGVAADLRASQCNLLLSLKVLNLVLGEGLGYGN